jgi:uncharacterized protein YpuA (DUF1002 family)
MRKSNTHIALLMMAIFVTIIVYGLYGYMYYTVDASLARVFVAREAVEKEQSYKNQEKSLTDMFEKTVSDRARLDTFFVAHDEIIQYIETIESLGKSGGATVALSAINADDLATSKVGTLGRISIAVDVRGTWSSVMRTLILAETLSYKVSVKNVRIDRVAPAGSPGGKPEWRVTFVLETVSVRVER